VGDHVIHATARSAAGPAEVFAVLADSSCWPAWGIWHRRDLEQPGAGAPEGPGAIRVLTSRTWGRTTVSRELVTDVEPDRAVGYRLLSGLPLRNYRARVELTPDGEGTVIHWRSTFERATPGTTWFYVLFFRRFLQDTAERVARFAETRRATS
jgi:Polyketide cyclase / dehydrase and lipid transport